MGFRNMATPFDRDKSHIPDDTMREWLEKELTGDFTEDKVPKFGPAGQDACAANGVDTTFKLLGMFFTELGIESDPMGACDSLKAKLHDFGCPASHLDSVIMCIFERIAKGFRAPMTIEAERLASSRMTQEKMMDFLGTPICGDLGEISGLGEKSQDGLVAAGITSTWQLIGKALMCNDAGEFEEFLKASGCAAGYTATVTHQIVERLANGITVPGL